MILQDAHERRVSLDSSAQHHEGGHHLSTLIIGKSDHCALGHRVVL